MNEFIDYSIPGLGNSRSRSHPVNAGCLTVKQRWILENAITLKKKKKNHI